MAAISPSLRFVEAQLIEYKSTWRSSLFSSFGTPIMFLAAMGLGLGTLVDAGTGDLDVSYLAFVATGLFAAGAMQNGAGEGLWRMMASIKWRRNFYGIITTPVGPGDIILGKAIYVFMRMLAISIVFAIVAALFGALEIGPALLAVVPASLTGLCFAMLTTCFTVTQENEESLATVFRLVILPLFLFSGTFFPISQLPTFLQPIAFVTPLYQGVEATRKLALPDLTGSDMVGTAPVWVNLAYLVLVTVVATVLAARLLDRRLRP